MADLAKLQKATKLRYQYQLDRLQKSGLDSTHIDETVSQTLGHIKSGSNSLVIYGEPQSGKTEMMICLTSKLLDEGFDCVVILVNDSLDLLEQNEARFRLAQTSPSPKTLNEVKANKSVNHESELVVFCKKNTKDLDVLLDALRRVKKIVVIDDEADFATPNGKINKKTDPHTAINSKVSALIDEGRRGVWIGVTATPARLDLNRTLSNRTDAWVQFKPHQNYVGHETFFPLDVKNPLRFSLIKLNGQFNQSIKIREALIRFVVNVGHRNHLLSPHDEVNYSMVVHTSGKKADHQADRDIIEKFFNGLVNPQDRNHLKIVNEIESTAASMHPSEVEGILHYVYANRQRYTIRTVNSDSDRATENIRGVTHPQSPFTVAIGGNIISRGVTFNNLLTLFFTRSTTGKIQQDTYIQRARMFGNRNPYIEDFELHVPEDLYEDWHRLFMLHSLALMSLENGEALWYENSRISAAAKNSIDKSNLSMSSGEISFSLIKVNEKNLQAMKTNQFGWPMFKKVLIENFPNGYLPTYLLKFIESTGANQSEAILLHSAQNISKQARTDVKEVVREQGFFGGSDTLRYSKTQHHFRLVFNDQNSARLIYKYTAPSGIKFLKMRG
jgi:Z1 domain/Type III restriction enzyme, res subunit